MALKFYGLANNYRNYTYYRNPKGEYVKKYAGAYFTEWRENLTKKETTNKEKEDK